MKLALISAILSLSLVNGFTAPLAISRTVVEPTTSLNAANDRRGFLKTSSAVATTAFVSTVVPNAAFAKDYVPKFDDMKQLYGLAVSLDRLAEKCADPDKAEGALEGLRSFNRDPNFYPG